VGFDPRATPVTATIGARLGQTRVDLLHLLEDLRDAYPGSLEETILTEIVANSLDSGGTVIAVAADAEAATLTVRDNGKGMTRNGLARFHDLATTSKRRGSGIGFAGVGIKLALLACDEALTESRRGRTHIATSWHLAARHRAPWKWAPPPGLVAEASIRCLKDNQGIAISTLGKVIKRGWDWLGVTPAAPAHVHGLIEAPPLAESLTLNKADFIRTGQRGATYLAYRKAIQEAVSEQLAHWGDIRDVGAERRRKTRPIERDMEAVLIDLSDDFPLLATLVERRSGGQRRLPLGSPSPHAGDWSPAAALETPAGRPADEDATDAGGQTGAGGTGVDGGGDVSPAPARSRDPRAGDESPGLPGAPGPRKPGRYGLEIRFADRPDDPELGRLVESTVWVNEAHAAWRRALRARAEGYHIALTVAMALAPLTVEPAHAHAFITTFLERWGREEGNGSRRGRKVRS
jgi:hypothetical protein